MLAPIRPMIPTVFAAVCPMIPAVFAAVCAVLAAIAPVLAPILASGGPLIVIQGAVPIRIEPLQDPISPRVVRVLSEDRPGGEQ